MHKSRGVYEINMKKAQTEMMGLVILVLLIVIAAIFAIRFMFFNQEDSFPELKLQLQADNLRNALLNLNIEDKVFSDIVLQCCESNCDFFKVEAPKLIEYSLPSQKYELELSKGPQNCYKTDKTCIKKVVSSSNIQKNTDNYNLVISLCY